MFTLTFWKAAIERALKSGAAAVLLFIGAAQGFNLFDLDPLQAVGVFAGGAVISVLMSLASIPFGDPGTPSAVKTQP